MQRWIYLVITVSGIGLWGVWLSQSLVHGQPPAKGRNQDGIRLTFEVVQSFDARYAGDTPGHMGRAGGLDNRQLKIALGDPVYRGQEKVGSVTELKWNRPNGSLDIEFDPQENVRVNVGDEVWMDVDGTKPSLPPAKSSDR
jgi:hypothetical protein